ncbi:hypothetical protein yinte0001_1430 [Yersinia intermedia ATCC 29909]|nr:hypothetical protein yinte0001_1430 [Yersinia intermedia ATCC 29909]
MRGGNNPAFIPYIPSLAKCYYDHINVNKMLCNIDPHWILLIVFFLANRFPYTVKANTPSYK